MAGEALARLLAALPEAHLLVGADGAIAAANRPAAELLAGAASLAPGRNLAEFVNGGAAALGEYLRACARSGQLLPGALRLLDGRGGQRAVRAEGALLEPRSGARPALLVMRLLPKEAAVNRFAALNLRIDELNREIARRRQAEHALSEERERLRVTLASIGDAVIATDR
ncbi:MAG TPA: hypothetical protein VM489_10970, partial [Burkholderiales bacterium]|nr:hypothetical protein [Burkholderiales bacterium]